MELTDLLNEKEWRKCKGSDTATIQEQVAAFETLVKFKELPKLKVFV